MWYLRSLTIRLYAFNTETRIPIMKTRDLLFQSQPIDLLLGHLIRNSISIGTNYLGKHMNLGKHEDLLSRLGKGTEFIPSPAYIGNGR